MNRPRWYGIEQGIHPTEDERNVRNEPEGPPHQWTPDEVRTEALLKGKEGRRG